MIEVLLENGSAREIFDRLKVGWSDLFSRSEESPFLSWAWMSSWFESFGTDLTPMVFTARRDGNLIGILAMVRSSTSVLGFRVDRAAMMGSRFGGADYLDIIAAPEDRAECVNAFLQFLRERTDAVDVLEFGDLASDSETCTLIKRNYAGTVPRDPRLIVLPGELCPQIDLSRGWQYVLDHSKRKSNFRRRLKDLQRMDGFQFRSVTDSQQVDAALDRFLQLHSRRWAASGGSEVSGHPRLISFHRAAVAALAEAGLVRFDELWVEGRCCASVYGFDDGRALYYYNSGYDPDLRHLSVGLVLLGLSIKAAAERRNSTYDLLRGSETYKFDWATGYRELVTLRLSKRRLIADALGRIDDVGMRLTSAAKRALPNRIAEPLANWRRQMKRKHQLSH